MGIILAILGCGSVAPNGAGEGLVPELTSRLEGTLTWTVDYDLASGRADCSYARDYSASQNESQRWVCPDCTTLWRAEIELLDPDGCYSELTENGRPFPKENIGQGGESWFRSGNTNMPLLEQGTATASNGTYTIVHETPSFPLGGGGSYRFLISGRLDLSVYPGSPWQGFDERPNRCGWELQSSPRYDGDYRLTPGTTLPDGFFLDTCNEPVRLHELGGDYLIVEVSALDCAGCQRMAEQTPAFVQRMAEAGVPTRTVTLLVPSLSDVLGNTSPEQLRQWAEHFGVEHPVLADRGWGYALGSALLGPHMAYPLSIVVAPDLEVIAVWTGFNGYDRFEWRIKEHADAE